MDAGTSATPAAHTIAGNLAFADLREALRRGWRDFRAAPVFGLFFAGIYVLAGLGLYFLLFQRGQIAWLIPAAAGFPLLAPFIAVGLYEVSRRRAEGLLLGWGAVLGALRGRGDEQLIMMGGFVFVGFTFWIILAHGIFAIFLSESGMGSESLEFLLSPWGLAMLAVGGAVGALMALLFYAITVISLPMMVDREVDFLTAMFASVSAVRSNSLVLIGWAVFMALALFAAMIPWFLGLLLVLPVLAHATFHLYRRTVTFAD